MLRRLLVRPLLLADGEPETFRDLVEERAALADWLAERTGWRLQVDAAQGVARLHKVPAVPDPTRPARRDPSRPPFDRRRYLLFAHALAALDALGAQTTLRRLAEELAHRMVEEGAPPFDAEDRAERTALVDVLRLLEGLGALSLRDGDAERYAQARDSDALYDVRSRVLGQLVSAPVPPALAGSPDRLGDEAGYPDSEEGRIQRARHQVFRRLLDDPVVYLDDLAPSEQDYLEHAAGHVYQELRRWAGLEVERRREGLAAVDPRGEVTDERFPEGSSTARHAALLVVEWLADRRRASGAAEVPHAACVERIAALHAGYAERCGWSKQYQGGQPGIERLAADALRLLAAFGLLRRRGEAWELRPALARFALEPPPAGLRGSA